MLGVTWGTEHIVIIEIRCNTEFLIAFKIRDLTKAEESLVHDCPVATIKTALFRVEYPKRKATDGAGTMSCARQSMPRLKVLNVEHQMPFVSVQMGTRCTAQPKRDILLYPRK